MFFPRLSEKFLLLRASLLMIHVSEIALFLLKRESSIKTKVERFEISLFDLNQICEIRFTRDLEGRMMRNAQIYACVLFYFLLKAAAFNVPS